MAEIASDGSTAQVVGIQHRGVVFTPLAEAMAAMDWDKDRPKEESFLRWRALADTLAKPGPAVG